RPFAPLGSALALKIGRSLRAGIPGSRPFAPWRAAALPPLGSAPNCSASARPPIAGGTHADEAQTGVLGARARAACARRRGGGDRALEAGGRGDVLDAPARRADEMMMVPGEILGQLPAGELVGADDAVHDPGVLQHHEVAVHRALGEAGPV